MGHRLNQVILNEGVKAQGTKLSLDEEGRPEIGNHLSKNWSKSGQNWGEERLKQ